MTQRNVLLVDIPFYSVPIISPYREVLERRLKAETVLRKQRIGFSLRRPGLTYSRGLLLIAAYLEQQGHHVRYLVYSDPDDARKFADVCRDADVIGFTALTPVVQQIYVLCKQAKSLNPSVLCVLGGPHASAVKAGSLEECPELDVVIPGEGEGPFALLVNHLDNYQDVAGIIYRGAGQQPIYNPMLRHEQLSTTADMPGPAYHLLHRPLASYAHNIRTVHGCPYKCNFCIERFSWRGVRGHNSLHRVVDEIQCVSQGSAGQTLIHFSDSVFTLNKERTLELCRLLAKSQLDVVFSCDTRVDHIDADIIKAMTVAGFVIIRLGVEVLDDSVLQTVNKDISVDQSLQAVDIIRSIAPQMVIHAYMLTGLPGSTMETFSKAAHNIRTLIQLESVDVIGNKILVPYPGTPYYDAPQQHKVTILNRDWRKFDRLSFPVYRLESLNEYEIYFGFLTLESVLLQAYEARVTNSCDIDMASPESLDYVYRSYVQQLGPRLEARDSLKAEPIASLNLS
jgi:anaerobic magnesium-protoporphyrin IX monomethyl ester cyclase